MGNAYDFTHWGNDSGVWTTTVSTTADLTTSDNVLYWYMEPEPKAKKKKAKSQPPAPKVDGALEWLDRRVNEMRVAL